VLPFLGEGLVHHQPGGGVHPRIGDGVQPDAKQVGEVIQVAEGPSGDLASLARRLVDGKAKVWQAAAIVHRALR
jgi:hypothetical protein